MQATLGMTRALNTASVSPDATSAARCASCIALCASIGWSTISPVAKRYATLVRSSGAGARSGRRYVPASVSHTGNPTIPISVDTVTSPAVKAASPPMRTAST